MGNIIKPCYGYLQHILKADTSSLVHKALMDSINMDWRGFILIIQDLKAWFALLNEKQKNISSYPRYGKNESAKICT